MRYQSQNNYAPRDQPPNYQSHQTNGGYGAAGYNGSQQRSIEGGQAAPEYSSYQNQQQNRGYGGQAAAEYNGNQQRSGDGGWTKN